MMKTKRTLIIAASFIALICGVGLNLYLSTMLTWGEMESALYINQNSEGSLKLNCPIMLADWETATVTTSVTNTLSETVTPMIQTQISHGSSMKNSNEIITLTPQETATIQRTADTTDKKFDKFILLSITQRPYRKLPSHQGTCSIFIYSLMGLTGKQSLFLILSTIFILITASIAVLFYFYFPFSELNKNLAQAIGLFITTSLLGLFFAIIRLWGLTIFLDVVAALTVMVIFTEILTSRGTSE